MANTEINLDSNPDAVLSELKAIKQLLVILLTKLGSDSGEIGDALGLDPRRIREWVSFKGIKRRSEKNDKKVDQGKERISQKINKEVMPTMKEVDIEK